MGNKKLRESNRQNTDIGRTKLRLFLHRGRQGGSDQGAHCKPTFYMQCDEFFEIVYEQYKHDKQSTTDAMFI